MDTFSPLKFIILIIFLGLANLACGHSSFYLNQSTLKSSSIETPSSREPIIQASKCPENSKISPCTCATTLEGPHIECKGSAVDQLALETTVKELRRVNGIPSFLRINIRRFDLWETELTELDLAPFYRSTIGFLYLQWNFNLTKLVTSGNVLDQGSIHASSFYLWYSPLNTQGFGDALKYFSKEMMYFDLEYLDLGEDNNKNHNSDGGQSALGMEFLPGLSALTNLVHLKVPSCKILGRLNSDTWNFTGFKSLEIISLSLNNITEIGEHVFDFDVHDHLLEIFMWGNQLNENSFHPNSGISQTGRKTRLELSGNQFTTIPANIFEPFLDAHPENSLKLGGTLYYILICDERLSWIKSRRGDFEGRVIDANCANDIGHTVFDSTLIP